MIRRWLLVVSSILILTFATQSLAKASGICLVARELAKKGISIFDKEDKKKGLAVLIKAHEMCPDDTDITYNLGVAYFRYGTLKEAYKIWKSLYDKGNRDNALMANLSWVALKLGNPSQALALAQEGLRKYPHDSHLLDTKAKALFTLGKLKEAYTWLAGETGPEASQLKAQAAKYLVDALWRRYRAGDKTLALEEAVELSRKYPSERAFQKAKDKMIMAMVDESVEIPLPPPPPSYAGIERTVAPVEVVTGDELDPLIAKLSKEGPKKDHAYAVIVGVSRYRRFQGPSYAVRDAQNFYRVLVKLGPFKNDTAHVKLLINQDATYTNLVEAVKWLLRKGRLYPDAQLLFYFSGHGAPLLDSGDGVKDGVLLPYDASLDALEDTGLKVSWLRRELACLKNKNVLVVADACFTGLGKSKSKIRPAMIQISPSLLTSTKPFIVAAAEKAAQEFAPGRQGAFTYFFLKGLMGEADGLRVKDGWVDAVEAYEYAKKKLEEFDLPQDPVMNPQVPVKLVRVRK